MVVPIGHPFVSSGSKHCAPLFTVYPAKVRNTPSEVGQGVDKPIVFAGDIPSQTISARLKRGEFRQISRGIYTTDLATSLNRFVARNWREIVGHEFAGAVITDRSAVQAGPAEGFLWLAHDARDRDLVLPGMTVVARRGAGPLIDDIALPGGLYLASRARALIENTAKSRARAGRPRRTLDPGELDDWIDHLCRMDGPERLQTYHVQADSLSSSLDASSERISDLGRRIGAALGTATVKTANRALGARLSGAPFDPSCLSRCDLLVKALRSAAPQLRGGLDPATDAYRTQAFFEAYFSNYIEGTTFTLDEAREIMNEGRQITSRQADSHDVSGTFEIVADGDEIERIGGSADEFIGLMKSRHATLMAGRGAIAGVFKDRASQAGNTLFVAPDLVQGTLVEGWRRFADLDTAWERAVYAMFLVADVHPFADGNGRTARIMMNSELVAGGQSKIIIPTVYRSDYLGSLRRLSRDDDPTVLVKALRFAHDYTAHLDWSSEDSAESTLRSTNAFEEDDDARLRMIDGWEDDELAGMLDRESRPAHRANVAPYSRGGRPVAGYLNPRSR